MKRRQRTIYFVDRGVQGSLMLRFVGYWVLGLAVMFGLLAAYPIMLAACFPFGDRPTAVQILAGTWAMFWPAMLASLMILPAVLWDLTRMSNRFVGPVHRLRHSMRDWADGKDVNPVVFREGDFWCGFAEDFNRAVATSRSTRSTNLVHTEEPAEFAAEEERSAELSEAQS